MLIVLLAILNMNIHTYKGNLRKKITFEKINTEKTKIVLCLSNL